jgi:hypothetical protein
MLPLRSNGCVQRRRLAVACFALALGISGVVLAASYTNTTGKPLQIYAVDVAPNAPRNCHGLAWRGILNDHVTFTPDLPPQRGWTRWVRIIDGTDTCLNNILRFESFSQRNQ